MTSRPGDESLRRAGFRDEAGDSRLRTGVVLLAGPHSEISLDRAAQLVIRGGDFERGPDRFVYVRTPSCIRKSTLEPMATERRTWRGDNGSDHFIERSYSACSRRIGGRRKLYPEGFLTGRLGGAGCS